MHGHVKRVVWLLALGALALGATAQSRSELEKKRQQLEKQIKETQTLLQQSQKQKAATVSNLQTLRSEIGMREELVKSLRHELDFILSDQKAHQKRLDRLRGTMEGLQGDHARQMRAAYIEKQMNHPILYVLSARTLNEAFLRWLYRRQIVQARKRTVEELRETTKEVRTELQTLEILGDQKKKISQDVSQQEADLKKTAGAAQAMVTDLEKKEKQLRRQLEQQEKERKALAAEIERIIAAEVRKSNATANLPAAPALKALSTEFARNKGKLPWPVEQGVVTSHFGNQPHPVVKTITITNNGIDITAPPKSLVRAVFGGKVVGRKFIPGFDHMIIIQHGKYYSVYSRLASVQVEIGQEVGTRELIGQLSGDAGENPRLHLEIWENKVQLDPELWITR